MPENPRCVITIEAPGEVTFDLDFPHGPHKLTNVELLFAAAVYGMKTAKGKGVTVRILNDLDKARETK
jgi:hypothetical protein